MGGASSMFWESKNADILVGKPQENKPLWRPRRRWVDDNTICLKTIVGGVD
jgi:hypothetical protein